MFILNSFINKVSLCLYPFWRNSNRKPGCYETNSVSNLGDFIMNITIVDAGNMGAGLVRQLTATGHLFVSLPVIWSLWLA